MTTIVVDREMGYIAADRMATSNDGEVACEFPKIRRCGAGLIACAGHESTGSMFEDWFEYGEWNEPLESLPGLEDEDDFTAVMLTPECEIWIADKFMTPYQVHPRWYAAGTGGPFAWAVLMAGCGIDKAMNTAIKMDPSSGFGYDIEYIRS